MSTVIKLPQNARICILRLSAIGDVCHAAAMVNRIRCARPDIKITWIIGKIEYQFLKGMDGVEFVTYDKKTGREGMKAIRQQLKACRFDVLCVMQIALRANLLSRAVRAKVRLGFDKSRSKEGHSLFINKRIAAQTHPHVLEGFMAFADAMGIEPVEKPGWNLPLSEQDLQLGIELKQRHQRYAVICPAASKAERNWTPQGYAAAAKHLAGLGLRVLLCGGPGPLDREIGDQIVANQAPVTEDLIGKTSLKELAGVLAQAEIVIAPDTGPAHMATAVGTPVVGLYAHSNPRRTGPYNNLTDVVSVYDECVAAQYGKPWQSLPWGRRVKGSDLMEKIVPEKVFNAIDHILRNAVK
ncbi:glycosyltransferase family 9 protein [Alteromonas lipolytica]|uniref:glycosyltransferase family 9 protein n=1 Tax=Alteromonas lipolytica TaxID=1856405 RepID=UPI000A8A616C|nr:glycosyltransferase family 9 protein [Alteromonas lipolytica]